ncbi:MAG: serine dehydrogenase proteinase [Firmicutes bacterium]|nr:serine dehydrogenase proteinase [Bacillota bacterium]
MDYAAILWMVFIMFSIWPLLRQQSLERSRLRLLQSIEQSRNSRLITLIHRQEAISFLGLPISRYITIEDSEKVLRAIRMTPDDMPIDLLLHTPGGLVLASEQIAHALMRHPAKVTVLVPHYAMSGGTMVALAADEIVMDCNAVLGPVDPQLGQYPAASILKAVSRKNINEIDDATLIMADIAEKAIDQVEEFLTEVLADKMAPEKARELARILSEGRWTHDYPITCDKLKAMGLPISAELPDVIYDLMDLYPQPVQRRPSVEYIPLPYERGPFRKPV